VHECRRAAKGRASQKTPVFCRPSIPGERESHVSGTGYSRFGLEQIGYRIAKVGIGLSRNHEESLKELQDRTRKFGVSRNKVLEETDTLVPVTQVKELGETYVPIVGKASSVTIATIGFEKSIVTLRMECNINLTFIVRFTWLGQSPAHEFIEPSTEFKDRFTLP